MGQGSSLNESAVQDANTMVDLVLLADTTEDRDCVGHRRLIDDHLSEPTFEGGILLDILAIFRESRSADTTKLATSQEGFEQVGCVHPAS